MVFKAYPLTVAPILKAKVWGGKNLSPYVDIKNKKTGEAWMLSDQGADCSVITAGALKGLTIGQAVNKYPAAILGSRLAKKYGKIFPLLFKYLDTNDDISVQVHPDDKYAEKKGFAAGKTEMWYILRTKAGASIRLGFKSAENKQSLYNAISSGRLPGKLKKYFTKASDSFFIPAGTVHAIGKGNLIFEIQQNSDITYRLYDWDRPDVNNDRPLHITDALNAVDFLSKGGKAGNKSFRIPGGFKTRPLARCGYFNCDELTFEKSCSYWYNDNKLIVITVIEGEIGINCNKGELKRYKKGGLVLIPFSLTGLQIAAAKNTRIIITEAR